MNIKQNFRFAVESHSGFVDDRGSTLIGKIFRQMSIIQFKITRIWVNAFHLINKILKNYPDTP